MFIEFFFSNTYTCIYLCIIIVIKISGKKSGVAAILKKSRPYLVSVHCLAHRLELSFKDTIKSMKMYDRLITLLLGIYYLYRKSPKLKKGLESSFQVC